MRHWEDGVFDLDIVETKDFRTLMFLLRQEQILNYCVEMGGMGHTFLLISSIEFSVRSLITAHMIMISSKK